MFPEAATPARLQMTAVRRFGLSNKARLNPALMEALHASGGGCDVCREIEKDIDPVPEGGDYVEAAGFPGKTIWTLSAHFKTHWKDEYELRDLSPRGS